MADETLDCLVVGAGPAGLTAAIYLARFRRSAAVLDGGPGRAALIPVSHNLAGFPGGVHGTDLLARMSRQAAEFGATILPGRATDLSRGDDGIFRAETTGGRIAARTVLLATGVTDRHPDIPDLEAGVRRGVVRYCAVCDGYEAMGRRVAVLGRGSGGLGEALFMRTYSASVTLLSWSVPLGLSGAEQERARAGEIVCVDDPVRDVLVGADGVRLRMADGAEMPFDLLYVEMGNEVHSGLARPLGTRLEPGGCVPTDAHQQTSTDGLFAAGDVVRGLAQISVAVAQAAIAATAIHNRLRTLR